MAEKYILNINCESQLKEINRLYNLINNYKNEISIYHRPTSAEKEVFMHLDTYIEYNRKEIKKEQQSVCTFFKDKLCKYWKLTHTIHGNNDIDYIKEFVIYPYSINTINMTMFSLVSNDINGNKEYIIELSDKAIMLEDFLAKNTTIELEEISKEEFINTINNSINNLINNRLVKLSIYDGRGN